jgi:hypothetical protein
MLFPSIGVAHFRNRLQRAPSWFSFSRVMEVCSYFPRGVRCSTWSRTAARSASAASVVLLPLPGARCRTLRFHFAPPHNHRLLLERLTLTTATGPSHACPSARMPTVSFAILLCTGRSRPRLPYYCYDRAVHGRTMAARVLRSAQPYDVNGPRRSRRSGLTLTATADGCAVGRMGAQAYTVMRFFFVLAMWWEFRWLTAQWRIVHAARE